MERFEFQVEKRFHRWRLDDFLFEKFREYSKAYLRGVLKQNLCELNGFETNGGRIVREKDFVEIRIDTVRAKAMRAQDIPVDVVYEDSVLLAVNKPNGVLVHPTHRERDETLLNGVTHYLNNIDAGRGFVRPLPIHRIDRETSGLVLFALDSRAARIVTKQFRDRRTKKIYLALVSGEPPDSGEIDMPIERDPDLRKHVVGGTSDAVTRFRKIDETENGALLEVYPETGRTNQIRVHFAHAGFPIVGDDLYGGVEHRRLCLHSLGIEIRHPASNQTIELRADDFSF